MILMRVDRVLGSCEINNYDKKGEGGWFPLDSVNFGFTPKTDTQNAGASNNKKGQTGGGKKAPQGNQGGANQQGDKFTEMSISKAVDVATVPLMRLAMDSRSDSGNKPADSAVMVADIHFIGSVNADQYSDIYTFTFLRIHLDTVRILKLVRERVGRRTAHRNGVDRLRKSSHEFISQLRMPKKIEAKIQAGWDQKAHKEWKTVTTYYPNFPDV